MGDHVECFLALCLTSWDLFASIIFVQEFTLLVQVLNPVSHLLSCLHM